MTLGNQVEWSLHCVILLASLPVGKQVSAKQLAEFHGVPKEYLSKSLQLLSRAGLVNTAFGPRGGYSLAKAADKISFLDVVIAVEGSDRTFKCSEIRKNNPCIPKKDKRHSPVCEIAAVMYEADTAWRKSLQAQKISDVLAKLSKHADVETFRNVVDWFGIDD